MASLSCPISECHQTQSWHFLHGHTHTHTNSDWNGARQTSDMHHCLGPPLLRPQTTLHHHASRIVPQARPGRAGPAMPACEWSSPDLADTSQTTIYTIRFTPLHNSHTLISIITCLWIDGGRGVTAGSPPPSLPRPSAWWAQGKQEERLLPPAS